MLVSINYVHHNVNLAVWPS